MDFRLATVILLHSIHASLCFDFDAEEFYESIQHLAPDKSVLQALESYFRNPVRPVYDENNRGYNPCCHLHTSRSICDPSCVLTAEEAKDISAIAHQIVTASGCSCKKVKYCTMQENGYRAYVIIVPTEFIRNVTVFLSEDVTATGLLQNRKPNKTLLEVHEIVGKHAPTKSGEMLMEWLAEVLRLFVWQNGRCDDDFVLTIMHDHHHNPDEERSLIMNSFLGSDSMMDNMNRISWSSGSAIMNKSTISDHCLDEVFGPLRNYLHKPTHLRLSIRPNDSSTTTKFADAISQSLTRLFKAINRRDDFDNPCYVHEGEDKNGARQQFKLLVFAGVTSIMLPFFACLFLAATRFVSRRYCTEDPWLEDNEIEDPGGQLCDECRQSQQQDQVFTSQLSPGISRLQLIPASQSVSFPQIHQPTPAIRKEVTFAPGTAIEPCCIPSRYYCGDHAHRLIYRYYSTAGYYSPNNIRKTAPY